MCHQIGELTGPELTGPELQGPVIRVERKMIVKLDNRLDDLVDPDEEPEQIASGFRFTEGPVWSLRDNCLTFSDSFGHRIHRWSRDHGLSLLRENSNAANGNTLDLEGRLLTCESRITKRVTRTNEDGSIEMVASHWAGKRFNSPNDLVCLSDGAIVFTDPPFGLRHSDGRVDESETGVNGVYRLNPDGSINLLTAEAGTPNGLVVTDGHTRLLVADTRSHSVLAFELQPDGNVGKGCLFADLTYEEDVGRPDGMKLDSKGNLYIAPNTESGVWIYNADGELLGMIGFPERPANLAWGDPDWQTLYVCAQTSVYRLRMKVSGQALNP